MSKSITVQTVVKADIKTVWDFWNNPEHIKQWLHASDDWECPKAVNDLKVGGRFSFTMGAKDKSVSFDLGGTYTAVEEGKLIAYTMDGEDARKVSISFEPVEGGVKVVETFDIEHENPEEMQRAGWQAIVDNFKRHVEASSR
jgi:uncharacterized protein YndB with AHSA1/START domain